MHNFPPFVVYGTMLSPVSQNLNTEVVFGYNNSHPHVHPPKF